MLDEEGDGVSEETQQAEPREVEPEAGEEREVEPEEEEGRKKGDNYLLYTGSCRTAKSALCVCTRNTAKTCVKQENVQN